MRFIELCVVLVAACIVASGDALAQEPDQPDWQFVQDDSLLSVQVFKDQSTLASGLAHNHVIRATDWKGELRFDPERPRACSFRIVVPVRQLAVDEPRMREQVGFEKSMSADSRRDVRESMLAEDQLDADAYPTVEISGKDCRPTGKSDVYQPRLTVIVRGQSTRLREPIAIEYKGARLAIEGDFTVRHSDFGIEPYSSFLGAVKNAQPIRFVAIITAKRSR